MRFLHSSSCNGPPLGCQLGYIWIVGILSLASILEGYISRMLAQSNAGQADAVHMGIHGIFYGSILFINFRSRKHKLSAKEEVKMRLKYARWNIAILLGFLAYLVLFETLPKLLGNTAVVYGPELIKAVTIGILGTSATLTILWKMRKDHEGDEFGKECDRGRKASHRTLFLDAFGDLAISLAILVAAVNIWIDPGRAWLDPILTLIAAGIIIWQAYAMLCSISQDELFHETHSH